MGPGAKLREGKVFKAPQLARSVNRSFYLKENLFLIVIPFLFLFQPTFNKTRILTDKSMQSCEMTNEIVIMTESKPGSGRTRAHPVFNYSAQT